MNTPKIRPGIFKLSLAEQNLIEAYRMGFLTAERYLQLCRAVGAEPVPEIAAAAKPKTKGESK